MIFNRASLGSRARVFLRDDRGSTVPLILGFYLIAFLLVAGGVLASDVFAHQRSLQSICDGAAIAAANEASQELIRSRGLGGTLPLQAADNAIARYLASDPERSGVTAHASLTDEHGSVALDCAGTAKLAFGGVIGRSDGVTQHATATSQGGIK